MISEDYFFSQVERLYIAFERPPNKAKAEILFNKLMPILDNDTQVKAVFDRAVECESFPTIKQMLDLAHQENPKRRIPTCALRVVECDCGHSFAITLEVLRKRTEPVPCTGKHYRLCSRVFHLTELETLFFD